MFVIRQATLDDLPTLLKLAKMVHFINLPADKDLLAEKIQASRLSFTGKEAHARDREWMFVLEDTSSGAVIGTSALIGCISWHGHPHLYFQVRKREHYSKDLGTGQVHVTIQLGSDETGASEVGGLILSPGYRGHPEKLGALLSLVRFHFIGLHRAKFSPVILAEMMGALDPNSHTPLWEYLGRRFINLSYAEADLFSTKSKEFIQSLFPKSEIYISLLPPEARNLIGKVGDETVPALRMLEKQGFQEMDHVDPFDGGPYLQARRDEIPLVKSTARLKVASLGRGNAEAIVSSHDHEHGFRAVRTRVSVTGTAVRLPRDVAEALGVTLGGTVGVTILKQPGRAARPGKAARSTAGPAKGARPRGAKPRKPARSSAKRR
ncbi:MAG: arginine N-succinyltransferase [Bacteroidia bacterium]|nr:arginine N-succinyltransferase [Bacteroidia bacterium]